MTKPRTAMVMAAGLGTRMRPLTDNCPKPLLMLAGKPLIEHVFDKLRDAGVSKAVVNIHYLPEMMEAYLERGFDGLDISVSDERDLLLETGGGLVKALPQIIGDPFFVTNSDCVWTDGEIDALTRLAQFWDSDRMDALLLVVPQANAHHHPGRGDFYLDAEGRLIRRGEADSAPYIYIGIQLIAHRLLRDAPEGRFSTNILWDRAIQEGRAFGLVHDGQWFDIGTPAAIAPTEEYFRIHG